MLEVVTTILSTEKLTSQGNLLILRCTKQLRKPLCPRNVKEEILTLAKLRKPNAVLSNLKYTFYL